MDNLDISSNPYRRRQFFVYTLVTLIALFSIRFLILPRVFNSEIPSFQSVTNQVLEAFIVALVSTVAITFLLTWLFPTSKEQFEIRVLSPGKELRDFLRKDLATTKEFWYRGHTAKWTRSVTLAKLAEQVISSRVSMDVYVIILDPDNLPACKLLADFDHARDPNVNTQLQIKYIQKQLIVTILSILEIRKKEQRLNIHLGLHKTFSLFRVDLSSESAIITRSSPNEPALRISAQSDFYRAFSQDLKVSFQQSKKVPIDEVPEFSLSSLGVDDVRELLKAINISVDYLNDDEILEVITLVHKA